MLSPSASSRIHLNLYAATLKIRLLHLIYTCGFNSSLGLNLNFKIESTHMLVMSLNQDFYKLINLNLKIKKNQ